MDCTDWCVIGSNWSPEAAICFYSATNRVIGLKLFWDGNGLWVCAKRLERGRFSWPQEETQGDRVRLTHEELTLLLGGIDLERTRAKNWYRYEEKNLEITGS